MAGIVYVAVMGSSTDVRVVGSYGAVSAPTEISKAMSRTALPWSAPAETVGVWVTGRRKAATRQIGIAISHHDLVTGDAPGVSR